MQPHIHVSCKQIRAGNLTDKRNVKRGNILNTEWDSILDRFKDRI